MSMRWLSGPAVVVAALVSVELAPRLFRHRGAGVDPSPPNATGQTPAFPPQTRAPEQKSIGAFDVGTVAVGLQSPWSLAFLPGGRMLVTERPGRLRIVASDGTARGEATRSTAS